MLPIITGTGNLTADVGPDCRSGTGCDDAPRRRGMCGKHYSRYLRHTPRAERRPLTPTERFAAKVDKKGPDDCWPFLGSRRPSGYGQFHVSMSRSKVSAHSFALELATGQACPPGLEGCHTCDNPPCCNPRHVYFGTPKQNANDCTRRRRRPTGQDRSQAKLSEPSALEIRVRFANGALIRDLANDFDVHVALVRLVVRGKRWASAGGPIQVGLRKPGLSTERVVA